jgi:hypothetical protein
VLMVQFDALNVRALSWASFGTDGPLQADVCCFQNKGCNWVSFQLGEEGHGNSEKEKSVKVGEGALAPSPFK